MDENKIQQPKIEIILKDALNDIVEQLKTLNKNLSFQNEILKRMK